MVEPEQPPLTPPPLVEEPSPVTPEAAPPPASLESTLGLSWVNRIGAFTLILAVAFFFKYAVDNQWIGESGRVLIGVVVGFATLGAAEWLWRRGHVLYSQGIAGAGSAILYLAFYAAFGFYKLVPPGLAFVLMVSAVALAGGLALRYNAPAIAALSLAGGYATPLLLSTGEDRPWALDRKSVV